MVGSSDGVAGGGVGRFRFWPASWFGEDGPWLGDCCDGGEV
jgi:hypothetical protein